jgi:vancomycin resistance protein VanW
VDRGAFDFACSATLSYNYVDLQIKNETAESFQINLWLDDEYLNGEIRSELEPISDYEVFETDHLINKIWKRSTRRIDSFVEEEMVADKHAVMMYGPY